MMRRQGQAVKTNECAVAGNFLRSLTVVVASLLIAGCSETTLSSDVPQTHTARSDGATISSPEGDTSEKGSVRSNARRSIGPVGTAYYTTSPAQGRPPDGELTAGTPVELLEEAGSYSLVAWKGQQAWIATDALEASVSATREIHKIPMH